VSLHSDNVIRGPSSVAIEKRAGMRACRVSPPCSVNQCES
jgi:hypothetical protein